MSEPQSMQSLMGGAIRGMAPTSTHPASSEPAAATKLPIRALGKITVEQARALGLEYREPPEPVSEACEFCGKILWRTGFMHPLIDDRVGNWLGIERCGCEASVERWAKIDADTERERQQAAEAERHAIEMARIQKLVGDSGMGRRFLQRTFETFVPDRANTKALAACKRYVDTFHERRDKGEGLYLTGSFGTGKTHLAAAIANALIARKTSVVLLTMQRILDCIKDSYDDDDRQTHEVLQQFRSCSLLIIDDLGKEQPTGWAQSELYRIINDRYEQMAPVIVTTNYSDDALADRLSSGKGCDPVTSEAIISRLHETTYTITMTGADRRLA